MEGVRGTPLYWMGKEERRELALMEQEQWADEAGLEPLHPTWLDDMSHWRFPKSLL